MSIDHKELLKEAYKLAQTSKDPSTQNSALLVNGRGDVLAGEVNRFPDSVAYTPERLERPLKYQYSVDAEHNVCCKAGKEGIKMEGLIMVSPWASCSKCAQTIIQCGIKELVTHKQALERSRPEWRPQIDQALAMLQEAGVKVTLYDGLLDAPSTLMSGERWNP